MHDNSYKTAEDLAAHLRKALRALAKRGSTDPSDLIFEAPETLHLLKNFGLNEGDLSLEGRVAVAIEEAVGELPSADKDAAEIILGLAPSARGQRLGARREQAAEALGVTAGTFRNRQEARLLGDLAKRIAADLLSSPSSFAMQDLRATSEKAFGFWSYVQDDDAGDGGRVLALSVDLRTQYKMRTAEELELFVDRESARWGEEWEKLISDAIAGTTFFIPIITPSYFRSNACRQELLKFVREADKAGLQRLLMPVYWITVPALESEGVDAADEAVRAVARHQWRDLRDVRLEDQTSSVYRKAVSGLAAEIADRASEVADSVDDVPPSVDLVARRPMEVEDDGGPGILEILAEGDEAFEKLTELMTGIAEDIQEVGKLSTKANEELEAATARGQGTKAALTITERYARQLKDPADRIRDRGQEFATSMASLDSSTHIRLDILEAQDSLEEDHVEFLRGLEQLAVTSDEALGQLAEMLNAATEMAKVSRSLRSPVRRMQDGLQGVLDGRAIIAEWGQRASDLRSIDQGGEDLNNN